MMSKYSLRNFHQFILILSILLFEIVPSNFGLVSTPVLTNAYSVVGNISSGANVATSYIVPYAPAPVRGTIAAVGVGYAIGEEFYKTGDSTKAIQAGYEKLVENIYASLGQYAFLKDIATVIMNVVIKQKSLDAAVQEVYGTVSKKQYDIISRGIGDIQREKGRNVIEVLQRIFFETIEVRYPILNNFIIVAKPVLIEGKDPYEVCNTINHMASAEECKVIAQGLNEVKEGKTSMTVAAQNIAFRVIGIRYPNLKGIASVGKGVIIDKRDLELVVQEVYGTVSNEQFTIIKKSVDDIYRGQDPLKIAQKTGIKLYESGLRTNGFGSKGRKMESKKLNQAPIAKKIQSPGIKSSIINPNSQSQRTYAEVVKQGLPKNKIQSRLHPMTPPIYHESTETLAARNTQAIPTARAIPISKSYFKPANIADTKITATHDTQAIPIARAIPISKSYYKPVNIEDTKITTDTNNCTIPTVFSALQSVNAGMRTRTPFNNKGKSINSPLTLVTAKKGNAKKMLNTRKMNITRLPPVSLSKNFKTTRLPPQLSTNVKTSELTTINGREYVSDPHSNQSMNVEDTRIPTVDKKNAVVSRLRSISPSTHQIEKTRVSELLTVNASMQNSENTKRKKTKESRNQMPNPNVRSRFNGSQKNGQIHKQPNNIGNSNKSTNKYAKRSPRGKSQISNRQSKRTT